jgi:hypothetical protein
LCINFKGIETTAASMQEETGPTEMEVETQIPNQFQSEEMAQEENVNSDAICNSNQEAQVLEVGTEQEPHGNQESVQQAQSTEQIEEVVDEHPVPDEHMQQEEEVPDNESQGLKIYCYIIYF